MVVLLLQNLQSTYQLCELPDILSINPSRTSGGNVGITRIGLYAIEGRPGEVKVQRRELENQRKIINLVAWSTHMWINWSLLGNPRSQTHPATGMAVRRGNSWRGL